MKTNEAPEKIHIGIVPNSLNSYTYITCGEDFPNAVEYTRTDAFIERAEKFLEDNLTEEDCKFGWSEWTEVKSGYDSIDSFMRAFRNYMKGE